MRIWGWKLMLVPPLTSCLMWSPYFLGAKRAAAHLRVSTRKRATLQFSCVAVSAISIHSLKNLSACASMPPNAGYVLGTDLNCSELLGCHPEWPVIHPFEITHIQGSPSFEVGEDAANGCDQPVELDRLGVKLVAPCRERLFALTGERMRGQRDDGDVAGLRTALEPSCSFPAVDHGHFQVHQDDIRALANRHCAALLAILRRQHLEIAEQLEPHLEHEDVVVVVFDVKHFGHDAASIPLLTAGFVCTSRRMRSTRSAGRNLSLISTNWTPAFNR